MKRFIYILMVLCLVGLADSAYAKDVKFEISLDKSNIALGETAQLGLTFYDTQRMPVPDIGNIDGLEIRYLGPSTMMTVLNGQISSSITHMYTVQPLRLGKFQLGPFSFTLKGNTYTSNMVFLEVTEERVQAEEKRPQALAEKLDLEDRIFLKLKVGKTCAYVNELIPVIVKLYVHRLDVNNIQLPVFEQEDFSKVIFREPKQYRENISGVVYDVLEFNANIFGVRPGDYRLGPAKIKCNAMVRKSMPRAVSMRDELAEDDFARNPYFDDFFTRYEKYPLELKSQDAHIIISPLPTDARPKDFLGAVGDYQFIYDANPLKLKVGDPLTLRMTINGTGNFNSVLMPRIENLEGFKAYEPQVNTEENTKTFTQVLIPETENISKIPRAFFSYFDPNKKEYKTITQGPIPIQVEKGIDEQPSQVVGSMPTVPLPEKEELTRDIIYIKEAPTRWVNSEERAYRSKVYIVLIMAPLLFLISLYLVQGRRNRIKSDSVYAGRLAAFRLARKGLKRLKHKLNSKDAGIFYGNVFEALQYYFGNRLNMPPAGITYDVLEAVFRSKDLDKDILRELKSLFDTCDAAKFAFFKAEPERMERDFRSLERIIGYFERRKT